MLKTQPPGEDASAGDHRGAGLELLCKRYQRIGLAFAHRCQSPSQYVVPWSLILQNICLLIIEGKDGPIK